jgi:hypothetical protein
MPGHGGNRTYDLWNTSGGARHFPTPGLGSPTGGGGYANFFMVKRIKVAN